MSRIAYVNGRYLAARARPRCSIEDRGYQFADGVYEVCEVRGGRLVDERRHMARLDRSLGELRIALRCRPRRSASSCARSCGATACATASSICRSRAASRARDHAFPPAGTRPSVVVTARSHRSRASSSESPPTGIAVITVPDNRWERVDIKSVSLLPNVLAKQAAREQGAREAWFVDAKGRVTEGSSSNAWIVTRDGKLVTRPLDHDILRGITRTVVLDVIKAQGLGLRGARLHRRGGLRRARGLHHLGEPDRDAGGPHRRPAGRQRRARA